MIVEASLAMFLIMMIVSIIGNVLNNLRLNIGIPHIISNVANNGVFYDNGGIISNVSNNEFPLLQTPLAMFPTVYIYIEFNFLIDLSFQ